MNKKLLITLPIIALLSFASCQNNNKGSGSSFSLIPQISDNTSGTNIPSISVPDPASINSPYIVDEFNLVTSDGAFTNGNNIYKITKAGTYTASGALVGQIVINASEDDKVILILNNAYISYDKDSPIKAINADEIAINVKDGSENLVKDLRKNKTVEDATVGEGAINAKVDLKIKGTGLLVIEGNYNNGLHTSDDLKIQEATIKSTAYNNALKGNDSITITSGTVYAISQNGQGIKTKNSDVSSKGNQRGNIDINGGTVYIDSVYDALDASYNINIDQKSNTAPTVVNIKTGNNSTYKTNYDKVTSAKAIKADNIININNGYITLAASDDAVHANYGASLDNGATGIGNVNINNGTLLIASGDDAIHADNTLSIAGGNIVIAGSNEGLEANHINISGGDTHIYGKDDGINASKKINETPTIEVSGGYLDISVANGDTDAIDSNGSFTQTGGVIVSRGSPGVKGSRMSTALDCDGVATISGGTFIAFNGLEKQPTITSNIYKAATLSNSSSDQPGGNPPSGDHKPKHLDNSAPSSFEAGNYKLSGKGIDISFVNNYQYGSFTIYSSLLTLNETYTLFREDSALLSWEQFSVNVTI